MAIHNHVIFRSCNAMFSLLNREGSANCVHILHSVHMLLYIHIVIGKCVHMIVESQ